MSEKQNMAESHMRGKEKRKWPKAKKRKEKNQKRGKNESTKCLSMPKA